MSQQINADEYKAFAAKLRGADKAIARGIRKRLRVIAVPVGKSVVTEGAQEMPSGGGLAAKIAANGRASLSVVSDGMSLRLGRKGVYLAGPDKGIVRHPVFWGSFRARRKGLLGKIGLRQTVARDVGNRKKWKWIAQGVPAGAFSGAFQEQADEVKAAVATEVAQIMKELGL